MKNSSLTSLLAVATLFLAPAVLSAQPAPEDNDSPRRARWQRFDTNNDGKLDAAERAAAQKEMRTRLSENPRFLARADTDKDGVISEAEWTAVKEKFKSDREHRRPKFKHRRDREHVRNHEFHRGYLLGRFDANGDGKLDKAERAQARAEGEKRMRARMEKQLARLKSIDADGDGVISDTEWKAARKNFRKELRERHPEGHGRRLPPPAEA